MAECGKYLGKGATSWPCPLESGHEGPCATIELPRTMRERERWEAEQRHQASGLAQFQGRAETTAERYTDGATDPPQPKPAVTAQEAADAPVVSLERHEGDPPSARVFRGGTVGAALDKAGVPVHVDPEAPAVPQAPTRANREHDQALPTPNEREAIQNLVLLDIDRRKKIGLERYGTLLQPFNHRNSARDAYEEALDLTMYLRQMVEEHEEIADYIDQIRECLDPSTPATPSNPNAVQPPPDVDKALTLTDRLLELLGR